MTNTFHRFIKTCIPNNAYDFRNKEQAIWNHIAYNLNRTQSMFKWNGLPESIPQRILELYLQVNGTCCFYEYNGTLYVFTGGLGGEPDVYYMPTIYTIANPAISISKNLKIDIDCVVVPNDSLYMGLIPLLRRYATQMTETELSILITTINARLYSLISAPDDRTKISAEKYLKDVEDGTLGVVADNVFLDGIKVQPYAQSSNTTTITNLIDLMQYEKASLYNELGLNANYNMKREAIVSNEAQMNNDSLLPLVDDMLETRRKGAEKVNKMFGTNITVRFSDAWLTESIKYKNEADIDSDQLLEDPAADPADPAADDPADPPAEAPEEKKEGDTE